MDVKINRLFLLPSLMRKAVCYLVFQVFPFLSLAQVGPPAQIGDTLQIKGTAVYGKPVDHQTRCVHWYSSLDIIAIKFKCCGKYYPCFSCHAETTTHHSIVWPVREFNEKAILCGVCGHELTITEYMSCNNTCPKCTSSFNPGCANHYHLYFETKAKK